MGKFSKKTLNTRENGNGKNKECENGVEKSEEKNGGKRKRFWLKWSSLFSRSSTKNRSEHWHDDDEGTQIPSIVANTQSQDMERWEPGEQDESIDANSQMLCIPLEPGRQVSTIILSPTKTGFKAVIAHYGINPSLAQSLTKDMNRVPSPFENRRTLTLVFDMNSTTFDDAAVGKSKSIILDNKQNEAGENGKNMSASALFVRTVTDDLVESAAFLQAQLSVENASPFVPQKTLPEEKKPNNESRRTSHHRSYHKSGVAFRTISEPLWRDKLRMQREMRMKQNVREVLNQFIFLERDDSLMNYSRLYEEFGLEKETSSTDEPYDDSFSMGKQWGEEKSPKSRLTPLSTSASSNEKLSGITTSSARNVSPDLLVNIKPFKEYVSNQPKLEFIKEKPVLRSEKIGFLAKRPVMMLGPPVQKDIITENSIRPKEYIRDAGMKVERPFNKSRLSQCIKCGVKAKGDVSKMPKDSVSHTGRGLYRKRDGSYVGDFGCGKKNSLKLISKGKEECTLCSAWKLYNKASFTSVNFKSDSVEDILKEIEEADHNSIFRRNISQFKTKIKTRSSPVGKPGRPANHPIEVIELEEGKLSRLKTPKAPEIPVDFPNVTLRLIEFVRKAEDKTVQFERLKKSYGVLVTEYALPLNEETRVMENSCLVLAFPDCMYMIKVMAQKLEESISTCLAYVAGAITKQEKIQFMFAATTNIPSSTGVTTLSSENKMEEYRGSYSRMTGQIPDLISHLWMDKIEDLRNELIARMNETRLSYDPASYHSSHLLRLRGRPKAIGRCSIGTITPTIFDTGGDSNPRGSLASSESSRFENSYSISVEPSIGAHSSPDKIPEEQFVLTQAIQGKLREHQEKSTELQPEDLQSAGPNDQIISFTKPDFKIHSCLLFFVPFVQQIQTAVQILNSTIYSFPVRKVDDQIDRNCLRILRSCTMLSDKKKYFLDNELESLVLKKCVEKNVVSGMTTSTTSKKEIMTIKGSRSGNHLLVTNKKILTTNDRIKKSEVLTGGIEVDSNFGMIQGENDDILLQNVSEDSEDLNGVQCLYYKKTDGTETRESSEESNYSGGKVFESQSSVIAISEPDDSIRRSDRSPGNNSEAFSYVPPSTDDEILNSNIANDSLQETQRGTRGQLSSMKSLSINLLQKIALDTADEGESTTGKIETVKSERKKSKEDGIIQPKTPESEIESVKVTEEKLIINEANESRVLVHEKVKASGDKIIKKTGEGATTQRLIAKKVGGKIVICRGDNCSPADKPRDSKRMSVVVTLARQVPDKKTPSKSNSNDSRKRGSNKSSEAKCPVPNENEPPKGQGETAKIKSSTPKRSRENSYSAIPRKR